MSALMFERHGDFDQAARAVRGYRQDLNIEFPTLNAVYGYPTAILVNRNGRVASIHTGFAGPATGRHYAEHVKEFRDEVEQLLAQATG